MKERELKGLTGIIAWKMSLQDIEIDFKYRDNVHIAGVKYDENEKRATIYLGKNFGHYEDIVKDIAHELGHIKFRIQHPKISKFLRISSCPLKKLAYGLRNHTDMYQPLGLGIYFLTGLITSSILDNTFYTLLYSTPLTSLLLDEAIANSEAKKIDL